jgi:hypothetical protein
MFYRPIGYYVERKDSLIPLGMQILVEKCKQEIVPNYNLGSRRCDFMGTQHASLIGGMLVPGIKIIS